MLPANFSPEIHKFETLESTNAAAREFALEGAPEGTVVVATTQEGGRGSHNRKWHSPPGGLYCSVLLRPRDTKRATDLGFLAGVAVAQTVKEVLPKHADVSVKWPNDCLVDWKKVAGVLCENLGEGYGNYCVIGIGLNVNVDEKELVQFSERVFPATSFSLESGGGIYDNDRVLKVLLTKLFELYHLYQTSGFKPIHYLWEKNCQFIGRRIELQEHGRNPQDRSRGVTTGVFNGIDESGAVVLTNEKGEKHQYCSGEISCFWR
jgi:BirA family biotin operon repressor/biotin-[acetyl-CoA-carboxylase] ligase